MEDQTQQKIIDLFCNKRPLFLFLLGTNVIVKVRSFGGIRAKMVSCIAK
jgi:hypothetical protein